MEMKDPTPIDAKNLTNSGHSLTQAGENINMITLFGVYYMR